LSPRGGKREGAGRPSRGLPTSKITVYQETKDLLSQYAEDIGISVVELMYRLAKNEEFKNLLKKIKDFNP